MGISASCSPLAPIRPRTFSRASSLRLLDREIISSKRIMAVRSSGSVSAAWSSTTSCSGSLTSSRSRRWMASRRCRRQASSRRCSRRWMVRRSTGTTVPTRARVRFSLAGSRRNWTTRSSSGRELRILDLIVPKAVTFATTSRGKRSPRAMDSRSGELLVPARAVLADLTTSVVARSASIMRFESALRRSSGRMCLPRFRLR